jgi:hypothetical protein
MNIEAFLTCLGYFGVSTGASASLEGVYSPSSGTTGIIYNQIYPTGYHFFNSTLYSPALPLVNVANVQVSGHRLTGNAGFRAGYQHSGNFGILMDIEYSGCTRATTNKGNVLLSTAKNPSGLSSGFLIGINDYNRLYFKTLNKSYTLTQELSTHDIIYTALTESQYVNFGIFKVSEGKYYGKDVDMGSGVLNTNDLYIGNFLNNTDTSYTGFVGKINQVLLFNDDLSDADIGICSNCSLVTGYQVSPTTQSFSGSQITGVYFSGVEVVIATGSTNVTGQIIRNDGSIVNILVPTDTTGVVQTGEIVVPLLATVSLQVSGSGYNFLYDTGALDTFSTFHIEFDSALTSGDVVEIYTYPSINGAVNNKIHNLEWPTGTGVVQLIGNGLSETKDVDYYVVRNAISGFELNDLLSYDYLKAPSIVTAYSGYWVDSRITLSGNTYFPSTAQYYEHTSFTGQVKITGLNQICTGNPYYPLFGYDLYMNGQKLVSGLQYNIVTSGSGFVVALSGKNLPQLMADALYAPTGGLPTGVTNVSSSELTFMPEFSGFRRTRYDITGTRSFISGVTGFSEQLWVNGIRQLKNYDYATHFPCEKIGTIYNCPDPSFVAYNSVNDTVGLWNYSSLPILTTPSGQTGYDGSGNFIGIFNAVISGLNGWPAPASGENAIEVRYKTSKENCSFSEYKFFGIVPTGTGIIVIPYDGETCQSGILDGDAHKQMVAKARYNYNNVIGPWSYSDTIEEII